MVFTVIHINHGMPVATGPSFALATRVNSDAVLGYPSSVTRPQLPVVDPGWLAIAFWSVLVLYP